MTDRTALIDDVSRCAVERGLTIATSESLTSGSIATCLGAGPDAASWFAGGLVAYQEQVKFRVLDVPEGPVVTPECAEQMARGARRLLQADVAVSATGVGGPDPSEGKPAGTVILSVATADGATTRHLQLDGDPEAVLSATVDAALALLVDVLEES